MERDFWKGIFGCLIFLCAQSASAEEIPYVLKDSGQLNCTDMGTGKSFPCESKKFEPKLVYVTHADALTLSLDSVMLRIPVNHASRLCYDLYYRSMSRPYCLDHPSIEITTTPELKNDRITLTIVTQTRGAQTISEIRSAVVFVPENKK